MKHHKKNLIIFITLSVLCILVFVLNYINYISVKIKRELTSDEFRIICDEFFVNIDDNDMVYLYHQGSERYGIKLIIHEYTAKHIRSMLNIDLNTNNLQALISNEDFCEYKASNGNYVSAKKIFPTFGFTSSISKPNITIYVFCDNGEYYMELVKSDTENISVFQGWT